jgi:signal transduction histidine kinase
LGVKSLPQGKKLAESAGLVLERPRATTIERVESVDTRMLVFARCVLAFSGLAIILIDPTEPQRLVELTYTSLVLYCIYSAALALSSYRVGWPAPARATLWIDVLFYVYLVALTGGTSSIFFFYFFFAILAASFSQGYKEGLLVTAASTALFTAVGLLTAPSGDAFELNRTLIRPVYLFVLGYMMAHWGGYEIQLRRRLRLLQEIGGQWNPRFGAEHTITSNLERLLDFYGASSCVLALKRPASPPTYHMYSALRQRPGQTAAPTGITESTANPLLRLPDMIGAIYHEPAGWWPAFFRGYVAFDLETQVRTIAFHEACRALANLLDAGAFVTVPYAQRDGTAGRIYLTTHDGRFNQFDLEFLAQASAAISLVVENMYLMEALINRAAENERLRISRDIHDTTIQPYIGLKLALDALQRDAGPDSPLAPQISELIEMAGLTIRDLRDYATTLREKTAMPGDFLVSAVKQQAERYGRFYGIQVEVKSDVSPKLTGRLPAEAYQIISEGLSNILRHTAAKRAYVFILCEKTNLLLKIGNEARDMPAADFTPQSIDERVRALGGSSLVEHTPDGYTVVNVAIPL